MAAPNFSMDVFPILAEKINRKYKDRGPNGCWVWVGSMRKSGIGAVGLPAKEFGYRSTRNVKFDPRITYPHRAVMMLVLGRELREDEHVRHTCPSSACGNPDHLKIVIVKRKPK